MYIYIYIYIYYICIYIDITIRARRDLRGGRAGVSPLSDRRISLAGITVGVGRVQSRAPLAFVSWARTAILLYVYMHR